MAVLARCESGHIHTCLDPRVSPRGPWVQIPLPPLLQLILRVETDITALVSTLRMQLVRREVGQTRGGRGFLLAPAISFPKSPPKGDLFARTPPATPERPSVVELLRAVFDGSRAITCPARSLSAI